MARTLRWGRPAGLIVRVAAPVPATAWRLHASLLAGAAVLAGAVAAWDLLARGGRGAFISVTGALAALAGLLWVAYAGAATALVAWRGRLGHVLALHAGALLLAPVLVAVAVAAWKALS
jgi:hypothetical protein